VSALVLDSREPRIAEFCQEWAADDYRQVSGAGVPVGVPVPGRGRRTVADGHEGRGGGPPSAFAESIRMWRQRLGWTQEDLSEASGLSTRAIRSLEKGRILKPRRTTVQLLADALQVPRARLMATIRRDAVVDDDESVGAVGNGGNSGDGGHPDDRAPTPRQLPPVFGALSADATTAAWSEISRVLHSCRTATQPRAAVLNVVGGSKDRKNQASALAIRAAHSAGEAFPDGQLYADLGGDPTVSPDTVLRRFLRTLDPRAAEHVPASASAFATDELAALLRSQLADRRMLLLVDRAATAEQVRPLIPAAPGCALVVTSVMMLELPFGAVHVTVSRV
jgi:DNA-binding XRE family transcriptional regulator